MSSFVYRIAGQSSEPIKLQSRNMAPHSQFQPLRLLLVTRNENVLDAVNLFQKQHPNVKYDVCKTVQEAESLLDVQSLTMVLVDSNLAGSMESDVAELKKSEKSPLVLVVDVKTFNEGGRTVAVDNPLTKRELEILTRVGQGLPNHQIAADLHVSTNSVKFHLKRCMNKLAARDRCHAVVEALRRGYL